MSDMGWDAEQECEWRDCDRVFVRRGQQGGIRRRFCSNSCRTKHHQWLDAQAAQHPQLAVRLAATRALGALTASRVQSSLPMMTPEVRAHLTEAIDALQTVLERLPGEMVDGISDD